jgi:hypothetical protein
MKRVCGLCILFLSACGEVVVDYGSQRSTQSVTVQSVQADQPDSLLRDKASIAFRDFRFGMTQNEYYETKADNRNYFYKIGPHDYALSGSFDDSGRLYLLDIEGMHRDLAELQGKVRSEFATLKDLMTSEHGTPRLEGEYPARLHTDTFLTVVSWKYFTKQIELGVVRKPEGTCCAGLRLLDEPLFQRTQRLDTGASVDATRPE